jgi:diguanylate cyclase (GGDEF)-like protein
MKITAGNLALVPGCKGEPTRERASDEVFVHQLVLALQTTLEVKSLLEIFSRHLGLLVPHGGYGFRNEKFDIDIRHGEIGRHSCTYTLVLEGETLGDWQLHSAWRLREADLRRVEGLLCHLLYPLRNALKYQEVVRVAHTDALTRTGNRAVLMNILKRETEIAERYGKRLSVIFLDIDHFKSINDNFGHHAGDLVLRTVAERVKEVVRASDAVFRYGGEEFVVVLGDTPTAGAHCLAERIRRAVEKEPCGLGMVATEVTLSLGVATLLQGESYMELLQRADEAMFLAKRSGRNRVELSRKYH